MRRSWYTKGVRSVRAVPDPRPLQLQDGFARMDTLTDIIWAAGFLDGEGCFGLFKSKGENAHPTTKRAMLSAGQKRKEPLDELQRIFGGNIHSQRVRGAQNAWIWSIQGEALNEVIPSLLPYLRLKRREAEIVLEYARTVKRRGRTPIPEDVLTLRGQLIEQMAAERGGVKA